MAIQDFPEWQRLAGELGRLSAECGATNGYILDAWANLWCVAEDLEDGNESGLVMDLTNKLLTTLRPPLNRGGRLDRATADTYYRSYGVYVLVLRFAESFDVALVRAAVGRALPTIEALTLLLPPPDGPESGGAAGFGVA